MLKQRVITAAILLLILVATLFSGFQWPFGVLLSILTACAIWEWLRLSLPERFGFAAIAIALLALLYFLYILYLHEQYLFDLRSEEHTSELQSRGHLVCRLLLDKKNLSIWT